MLFRSIRCLHDELVDGRAQKLRRLFQRHAHLVRNAGRDPLARFFHYMFHAYMVPLCHRAVNGLSGRPLSVKLSVKVVARSEKIVANYSEFPLILQCFLLISYVFESVKKSDSDPYVKFHGICQGVWLANS